jgi:hypothetical protein
MTLPGSHPAQPRVSGKSYATCNVERVWGRPDQAALWNTCPKLVYKFRTTPRVQTVPSGRQLVAQFTVSRSYAPAAVISQFRIPSQTSSQSLRRLPSPSAIVSWVVRFRALHLRIKASRTGGSRLTPVFLEALATIRPVRIPDGSSPQRDESGHGIALAVGLELSTGAMRITRARSR